DPTKRFACCGQLRLVRGDSRRTSGNVESCAITTYGAIRSSGARAWRWCSTPSITTRLPALFLRLPTLIVPCLGDVTTAKGCARGALREQKSRLAQRPGGPQPG